jgi:hypothetical protein
MHSANKLRHRVAKSESPAAPGQVFRLSDMDIEEVSLVDRAANMTKFLVVKRSDHMATEIKPNGKGGFSSATNKDGKSPTAKAGLEMPPGFKEMVTPLLDKTTEILSTLSGDLKSSSAAAVGDDGTVPGVPAEFLSGLQGAIKLLDQCSSMFPEAPPDADLLSEDAPPPEGDGGADEQYETQMRAALDNVAKVLGSKYVRKATVTKVGAKMSKERFTRLQQAAQVLSNLISELGPTVEAAGATAPASAPPLGKTAKSEPVPNPEFAALTAQLAALVDHVGKMASVLKSTQADLNVIKKSRGAPSASAPEFTTPEAKKEGFSWALDMAKPLTRENVDKSEWFTNDDDRA